MAETLPAAIHTKAHLFSLLCADWSSPSQTNSPISYLGWCRPDYIPFLFPLKEEGGGHHLRNLAGEVVFWGQQLVDVPRHIHLALGLGWTSVPIQPNQGSCYFLVSSPKITQQ